MQSYKKISAFVKPFGGTAARLVTLSSMAALVALPACGDGDAPTTEEYDDVAAAVAPLVVGETGDTSSMSDAATAAEGEVPPGFSREVNGEVRGPRGGVTFSYTITCQDASGATQATCDDLTDTASVQVSWNGDIDTARYAAGVSRDGSWTLTGLTGSTAELNGSGTFDLASEFESLNGNRTRTYLLSYAANYDGVQLDTASREAIGGSATFDINAQRTASNQFRDVEASFDIFAEVTFTADGATLVLDGTRAYDLVAENGTVVAVQINL